MNVWVGLTVITLNLIFGFFGYFLGKKVQVSKDLVTWTERMEALRASELEGQRRVVEALKKLERERKIFSESSWNEKVAILEGKNR